MPHDDFALCLPITPLDVEHLTKPSTVERLPADERTAEAPEAVEPGERPFDHPPVASQAVLGLDTTAGDSGDDAALAQGQTEVTVVVTLVGM